jgi:dTDP-4-dehydrorhamnose reductase
MSPLLITGAGGFLGWNLCLEAAKTHPVAALYRRNTPPVAPRVIPVQADLTRPADIQAALDRLNPAGILHSAALASPAVCEADPEASHAVNVAASEHLARLCAERGIPLVYISTDLVFDGVHPPYAESDPASPVSTYGRHKALAEERVLAAWPEAVVCRVPLLFGFSGSAPGGFLSWMLPSLHGGKPLRLFTDEIRTPVDARTASLGLLAALRWKAGIYHLGGGTPISRWQIGQLLARMMAVESLAMVPLKIAEADDAASRPADVSLSCEKARKLGWRPPDLASTLARAVRRWQRSLW